MAQAPIAITISARASARRGASSAQPSWSRRSQDDHDVGLARAGREPGTGTVESLCAIPVDIISIAQHQPELQRPQEFFWPS